MWTYSPQKRQVDSAFALTYILLLRSCKLIGDFVIPPLPPVGLEFVHTAGPLRSTGITPLHATTGPSATLSSSTDFPASPVIRFPGSADFSTGRGGLLQLLKASLSSCCR